jgi:hypothetical protein
MDYKLYSIAELAVDTPTDGVSKMRLFMCQHQPGGAYRHPQDTERLSRRGGVGIQIT